MLLTCCLSVALCADVCTETMKINDLERYSVSPEETESFCYESSGDNFFVFFHKITNAKVTFVEHLEGDDHELNRIEYSKENPIVAYKFPSAGRVIIKADGKNSRVDFAAISLNSNCKDKIFLSTKNLDRIEIGEEKSFKANTGDDVCLFYSGFPTVKTTILNPSTSTITITSPATSIAKDTYVYDVPVNGYIKYVSNGDVLVLTGNEQGEADFAYRGSVNNTGPLYFNDVQIPTNQPKYPDGDSTQTAIIIIAVAVVVLVIVAVVFFVMCRRRGSGYTIVPKEELQI